MEKFWKAAVGAGGLGSVGAFVFWALYNNWLSLPIFSQLTQEQTFIVMLLFLGLTFLSLVTLLVTYIIAKKIPQDADARHAPIRLLDASLHRDNVSYRQSDSAGDNLIQPTSKEP